MHNLNESPEWNIQPDPRGNGAGAGDGSRWNYASLLGMAGLAAFYWIQNRKSQSEIQTLKAQNELELKKSRQVLDFKDMIIEIKVQEPLLYNPKLQKTWKEEDIQRFIGSLNQAPKREEEWHRKATTSLKELEGQLVERQHIYCSYIQSRAQRQNMEKNMLLKVAEDPIVAELDLESDLRVIFKTDQHCANLLNKDKRKNGKLMWGYLKYWQLQIEIQKKKRAMKSVLEIIQSDRK